jgi:hypothetical protein
MAIRSSLTGSQEAKNPNIQEDISGSFLTSSTSPRTPNLTVIFQVLKVLKAGGTSRFGILTIYLQEQELQSEEVPLLTTHVTAGLFLVSITSF